MEFRLKIIILDTEMSGSMSEDRLVSIAIGELQNEKLKKIKKGLFNPGVPVKQGAFWVHKISDRVLEKKPDFKKTEFYDFLKDFFSDRMNVVIGHAICNDLFIIAKEGIRCTCKIIDTQYCATKIFQTERSSLNFLANEYNLIGDENIKFHTAEGDVKVTHKLLLELLKHHSFDELIQLSMEPFYSQSLSADGRRKKPVYTIAALTPEKLLKHFTTVKDPKMFYALTYFHGNAHLFENNTDKSEVMRILNDK